MNLETKIHESKAIFFDLFHTLFSFKSDGVDGVDTSVNLGIPDEVWTDLLFDSSERRLRGQVKDKYEIIRELAHSYDRTIPEKVITKATDLREERFSRGLKHVSQEKIHVLHDLRNRGKKIGLISNADSVEVSGWKDSPFSECFDTTIFSYATGYIKPEPEIYLIACDSISVKPTESVFVGDGGSNELKGARNLGFSTVMTTEIIETLWPEKIPAISKFADYQIKKLKELTKHNL